MRANTPDGPLVAGSGWGGLVGQSPGWRGTVLGAADGTGPLGGNRSGWHAAVSAGALEDPKALCRRVVLDRAGASPNYGVGGPESREGQGLMAG